MGVRGRRGVNCQFVGGLAIESSLPICGSPPRIGSPASLGSTKSRSACRSILPSRDLVSGLTARLFSKFAVGDLEALSWGGGWWPLTMVGCGMERLTTVFDLISASAHNHG